MEQTPSYAKENRQHFLKVLQRFMCFVLFVPWNFKQIVPLNWHGLVYFIEIFLEILFYIAHLHLVLIFFNIFINFHTAQLEFFAFCMLQCIVLTWSLFIKVYHRRIGAKTLQQLLHFLNDYYWTRSAPGFTYVTIDNAFKQANNFIRYYFLTSSSVLIFFLFPLMSEKRYLPLPCWYPFDYKQPYIYELVYLCQYITQAQVVYAFSCSSGLFVVLSMLIAGQFDILNCSLKNILATSYLYMNASKQQLRSLKHAQQIADGELNVYFICPEQQASIEYLYYQTNNMSNACNLSDALRHAIADCVLHHRLILSIMQQMENFYNPAWLMKWGQFVFLTCLLGFFYAKSTLKASVPIYTLLAAYFMLALLELFLICHFAEMITQGSHRCGEALMRSPWFLHAREMRQHLIIMMIIAKRSCTLTAGKIYPINYESFRTLITTSFSFITFLKYLDKEKS